MLPLGSVRLDETQTTSTLHYKSTKMLLLRLQILTVLVCSGYGLTLKRQDVPGHEVYDDSNKFVSVEGHYKKAAVSTDNPVCSTIGKDILAKGGSAVDSAIAVLLCLGVADPMSSGIGGGHFLTYYQRSTGNVYSIIAREMAPSGATTDMFTNGQSSVTGGLAIAVPGEVLGIWEAYRLGGRLPWADIFQPVIELCQKGVLVSLPLEGAILYAYNNGYLDTFTTLRNVLTNPETAEFYKQGEYMRRPRLAETLKILAERGATDFYTGGLAKTIASEISSAGGIVTEADLKSYYVSVKPPLKLPLPDNMVLYSPPPPSGGAVLSNILNILQGYNIKPDDLSTTDRATLTYHRIAEAFKFAYAKRSLLGDPDGEDEAFRARLDEFVANMTSPSIAASIREKIFNNQTFDVEYYEPAFQIKTDHGTTHMSVLAPDGDAVAATTTINLYFGSMVVGEKTGIIYNNEMDDFSTPNTINYFGVPASPANYIKPGKRPLSSMCPAVIVDGDGHVVFTAGASGGTRITTSVALTAIQTLWFGQGIKEAIDSPRLHHQLVPNVLELEMGFPKEIEDGLRAKGHNIKSTSGAGSVVQGILQLKEGEITANADYRKRGAPDGF